jgi:flagellar basal body rod protein FlgC
LHWLQDPSEINLDNLNNIRRETRRHFRNKKREYLKDKIDELATNSKNKNIRDLYRGTNDFKRGYQPRSNLVNDENGLVACLLAGQNHDIKIGNRCFENVTQFRFWERL